VNYRLACSLFAAALLSVHPSAGDAQTQITGKHMRKEAGETILTLPLDWIDASDYAYSNPDGTINLRVSRLDVDPAASTTDLLTDRMQRLSALGQIRQISRSTLEVDHVASEWVEIEIIKAGARVDDVAAHIDVHLLMSRPAPNRAVILNLTGPLAKRKENEATWMRLLQSTSFTGRGGS
jgi:hypothetical protein